MKRKFFALMFSAFFLSGVLVFAASDSNDLQNEANLKAAREQIAETAEFIRQINSDPKITPEQKKIAIADFIKKENEKAK